MVTQEKNEEAENNLTKEDTQAEKTNKTKGWVTALKPKSKDKEGAKEKQQDKRRKVIEYRTVSQSTEEATQAQEITKQNRREWKSKP